MHRYRLTQCPETGDISFECVKCVRSEESPSYDTYNRPFSYKVAHPGQCHTCFGRGFILEHPCPSCNGSGICSGCDGKAICLFRELPLPEQKLWNTAQKANMSSSEEEAIWLAHFRDW
jgi:hypothetical protein